MDPPRNIWGLYKDTLLFSTPQYLHPIQSSVIHCTGIYQSPRKCLALCWEQQLKVRGAETGDKKHFYQLQSSVLGARIEEETRYTLMQTETKMSGRENFLIQNLKEGMEEAVSYRACHLSVNTTLLYGLLYNLPFKAANSIFKRNQLLLFTENCNLKFRFSLSKSFLCSILIF